MISSFRIPVRHLWSRGTMHSINTADMQYIARYNRNNKYKLDHVWLKTVQKRTNVTADLETREGSTLLCIQNFEVQFAAEKNLTPLLKQFKR